MSLSWGLTAPYEKLWDEQLPQRNTGKAAPNPHSVPGLQTSLQKCLLQAHMFTQSWLDPRRTQIAIFTHFALKFLCERWTAHLSSLILFLVSGTEGHTRHPLHIPTFWCWMHFSPWRTRSGRNLLSSTNITEWATGWALPQLPHSAPAQPWPSHLFSYLLSALDGHSCSKRQEKHGGCYSFSCLSESPAPRQFRSNLGVNWRSGNKTVFR